MTADLDRALLVWPLVVALVTTFGTAGFVLLSAGERVFDLRAAAASLLTLWQVLTAVIFLLSPLVVLNVTADMAGVSWTSAVGFVPQVLAGTMRGTFLSGLCQSRSRFSSAHAFHSHNPLGPRCFSSWQEFYSSFKRC